jgi:AbrB family looped-hinge helix DNA binding protein
VAERKLVRVQEKGQITLPAAARRRLGVKKGDLVAVVETEEGVLITPQEVLGARTLAEMGRILKESGVDLNELIASGRDMRGALIEDKYGLSEEKPA